MSLSTACLQIHCQELAGGVGCGISSAPTPLQPHHCFPASLGMKGFKGSSSSPVHTGSSPGQWGQALCRCMAGAQETAIVTGAVGTVPQLAVPPRPEIPQQNPGRGIRPFLMRDEALTLQFDHVLTEAATGFTARRWHLCLTCALLCVVTTALFLTPPLHRDTVQGRLVGRDHLSGRHDHP